MLDHYLVKRVWYLGRAARAKQEVAQHLLFLLSLSGQVRMARKNKDAFLPALVVFNSGQLLMARGRWSSARGLFRPARG